MAVFDPHLHCKLTEKRSPFVAKLPGRHATRKKWPLQVSLCTLEKKFMRAFASQFGAPSFPAEKKQSSELQLLGAPLLIENFENYENFQ